MATLPGLPSAAGQFLLLAPPRNSPSGWQVRLHHCLGLFTRTDLAGRKRCASRTQEGRMALTRWSSNPTWGNVWKRMASKHVWNYRDLFSCFL